MPPARIEDMPVRGLRLCEAARYVGMKPTFFDRLVKDGRMPRPKRVDGLVIWDVRDLDIAFEDLPSDAGEANDGADPYMEGIGDGAEAKGRGHAA